MSSYELPQESVRHTFLTGRDLDAAMAEFERLCGEAGSAMESLQLGKAERLIEQAISLADATPWVTTEQKESRLKARDLAIEILAQSSCCQQALEYADQQMIIYGSIHNGYSLGICLMKSSLLLALERYEDAEGIIRGIIERGKESGDLGDVVVGHIHYAQCLAERGESARSDYEISCACSFLTQLNPPEALLAAESFREYAIFERERGDLDKAIAAAELVRQCLNMFEQSNEKIAILMDDIDLFQAEVYAVNGDPDKASDIRFKLLTKITNSLGRLDPKACQLRILLGDAALYRGDLEEAENYYRLNLNLAKQSGNAELIHEAVSSLAGFCHQTGTIDQLGDDLDLFLDISSGIQGDSYQYRIRMLVIAHGAQDGLARAVTEVSEELENFSDTSQLSSAAFRCELLLLLAELKGIEDDRSAIPHLDEAERLAIGFPAEVSEAFFERINDLRRACSVEEKGFGGQIERIQKLIQDHRERYGNSQPYVEAKLRLPLGLVYIHEEEYGRAEHELERARELLEKNRGTESKLYGQVLMGLATALERQFHNVDYLRERAKAILGKYDRDKEP